MSLGGLLPADGRPAVLCAALARRQKAIGRSFDWFAQVRVAETAAEALAALAGTDFAVAVVDRRMPDVVAAVQRRVPAPHLLVEEGWGDDQRRLVIASAPARTRLLDVCHHVTDAVFRVSVLLVAAGDPTYAALAAHFGCSPRTINRHLDTLYRWTRTDGKDAFVRRILGDEIGERVA